MASHPVNQRKINNTSKSHASESHADGSVFFLLSQAFNIHKSVKFSFILKKKRIFMRFRSSYMKFYKRNIEREASTILTTR